MRARNLLWMLCIGSCLTIACGDDDDDTGAGGGSGGTPAEAGAPGKAGTAGASSDGGKGGEAGTAGAPVGEAGEPGEPNPGVGGAFGEPGAGGAGGQQDGSFVDFVHDLVRDQTSDAALPSSADRQFREERDARGHYLTPNDAFDDLF